MSGTAAQIGVDCQIVLDGAGYFVAPHGYAMQRSRLRKAVVTKDGAERYVDLGPGKREWQLVILCLNGLVDYTGTPLPLDGEALRESLRASYDKHGPLPFIDLDDNPYSVHFDHYQEQVRDARTQLVGVSFHVAIVLVEA